MCDSRGAMPCPAGITVRAAVILDACHRWHVLSMCLVQKFTRCGLIVVTSDFHALMLAMRAGYV